MISACLLWLNVTQKFNCLQINETKRLKGLIYRFEQMNNRNQMNFLFLNKVFFLGNSNFPSQKTKKCRLSEIFYFYLVLRQLFDFAKIANPNIKEFSCFKIKKYILSNRNKKYTLQKRLLNSLRYFQQSFKMNIFTSDEVLIPLTFSILLSRFIQSLTSKNLWNPFRQC